MPPRDAQRLPRKDRPERADEGARPTPSRRFDRRARRAEAAFMAMLAGGRPGGAPPRTVS